MARRAALLLAFAALALPARAHADGGRYSLVGGTKGQRQTVVAALNASTFDWSVVPAPVTIEIVRGHDSEAVPGTIWLDADLLDAGQFAWGVVQHEYAHQVDYLLLDDWQRSYLQRFLGGVAWCTEAPGLEHGDYGCERFASTLAWSYWPSPNNCMKPASRLDESAALPPRRFRALVDSLLGSPAVRSLR
jgi:hypothetical protein